MVISRKKPDTSLVISWRKKHGYIICRFVSRGRLEMLEGGILLCVHLANFGTMFFRTLTQSGGTATSIRHAFPIRTHLIPNQTA